MSKVKEMSFFDLDNTLWFVKSNAWVIEKNNPSKPLMKIDNLEFALINNGIYINEGNLIEFNNQKFYVSDEFVKRLEQKKKNIQLEQLGISYAEYFDEQILEKKEVKLLLNNVRHLIGTEMEIGLISARADRKKHAPLLNKLRLQLEEYGLEINRVYFVTENLKDANNPDKLSYEKNKILLEHLIGLEIEGDKFIPMKKDAYNRIYFYDDTRQNFLGANYMQEYFEKLMLNSDDDVVEYIKNRLKAESLILVNNLVTNNEVNPFDVKIVKLKEPAKYPILMDKLVTKFSDFKR